MENMRVHEMLLILVLLIMSIILLSAYKTVVGILPAGLALLYYLYYTRSQSSRDDNTSVVVYGGGEIPADLLVLADYIAPNSKTDRTDVNAPGEVIHDNYMKYTRGDGTVIIAATESVCEATTSLAIIHDNLRDVLAFAQTGVLNNNTRHLYKNKTKIILQNMMIMPGVNKVTKPKSFPTLNRAFILLLRDMPGLRDAMTRIKNNTKWFDAHPADQKTLVEDIITPDISARMDYNGIVKTLMSFDEDYIYSGTSNHNRIRDISKCKSAEAIAKIVFRGISREAAATAYPPIIILTRHDLTETEKVATPILLWRNKESAYTEVGYCMIGFIFKDELARIFYIPTGLDNIGTPINTNPGIVMKDRATHLLYARIYKNLPELPYSASGNYLINASIYNYDKNSYRVSAIPSVTSTTTPAPPLATTSSTRVTSTTPAPP